MRVVPDQDEARIKREISLRIMELEELEEGGM